MTRPVLRDAALFTALRDCLGRMMMTDAVKDAAAGTGENTVENAGENAALLARLLLHMQAAHACFTEAPLAPAPPYARLLTRCAMAEQLDAHSAVSHLARQVGLRRESFSRAFRRATGLPPQPYLHCLRLELARRLLRQGKSIVEAALAAGYTDQSHFHRTFLKYYSVTPGAYARCASHAYKK